jgi:hypothetical protein
MVSEPETGWLLIQCDWSERQGDAEPEAPGVVGRVVARLAGYARAAHGAATRKAASRSSRSL